MDLKYEHMGVWSMHCEWSVREDIARFARCGEEFWTERARASSAKLATESQGSHMYLDIFHCFRDPPRRRNSRDGRMYTKRRHMTWQCIKLTLVKGYPKNQKPAHYF